MFKKVNVPIHGIVENMSFFICDNCEQKHYIFSNGGVRKEAKNFNIPFLGELPLDKDLRIQSDEGKPSCIHSPNSSISKIYLEMANKIISSNNT